MEYRKIEFFTEEYEQLKKDGYKITPELEEAVKKINEKVVIYTNFYNKPKEK